jgi:PRTRC genetic system protein E
MFQQLMPLLRHRSVLLTVTHVGEDQVRVNVVPRKIAEGENDALTTPMSFTGTAEELDSAPSPARSPSAHRHAAPSTASLHETHGRLPVPPVGLPLF